LLINLTPLIPLSFQGEGEGMEEGLTPLLDTPFISSEREAKPLLYNYFPLPLNKGKGIKGIGLLEIKGEGLVNNLSQVTPPVVI